ncbi:MAG: ribosomal protein S18-alanine N-acetyltransferase [Aquabacterium sp.]|uniref:ribosomal protein S18-alanine N-acetyltransferase n=1 Tax=Aquabacterium sp. TaxID=1872578 RepID=UPI00271ACE98|nr:ribosomal protein S18-alanine N-acetyltransferase [Aquabacterium sp.]MDO9005164.1 ribosomal protein S18-alanine N-acetyltransferase [Aquabacterium sp.]
MSAPSRSPSPLFGQAPEVLAFADRPMTEADIPAVLEMERQACPHPAHAWSEDNYRSSLRSGYWTRVRTQPDTGRIVGVCVAMDGVEEMHLLNIAVDKALHGSGLARGLLDTLYVFCRQTDVPLLWLEVRPSNERALGVYRRQGFVEVGVRKGYYPAPGGREDALVMRLDLTKKAAQP